MNLIEAVQILRDHNAYRRHDGLPCDPPHDGKTVGQAIDAVCDVAPAVLHQLVMLHSMLSGMNPVTIKECGFRLDWSASALTKAGAI